MDPKKIDEKMARGPKDAVDAVMNEARPAESPAKKCEKHGVELEIMADSLGNNRWACPQCVAEADAERKREEWIRLNQQCRIEPEFYDATLETYRTETDEQRKALSAVTGMVHAKVGKLLLMGSNGTGKTHLASAVVRALRGEIWTMYEITTRIRESYKAKASESELQIVEALAKLPILAIDEIGRTKGSDAETNWLSFIIDKRHVRCLPLILITNKHRRKDCEKNGCPGCLENYIGADIMSRLNEDGLAILFAGEDYRKRKRAEARKEE